MRDLLRTELTRLRWRRAVLMLTVGAVVLPLLLLATVLYETRPVSDAELAGARQQATELASSRGTQRELARCTKRPDQYGVPDYTASCEEAVLPSPSGS